MHVFAALMLNAIIVECNDLGAELEHTNSHQVWVVARQQLIPSWKSSLGCLGWLLTAPALLLPIQVTPTAKGTLDTTPHCSPKSCQKFGAGGL